MAMHFKQSFDLKRIKRKLGFKDRPEYIALAQVASDEDGEIKKTSAISISTINGVCMAQVEENISLYYSFLLMVKRKILPLQCC